MVDNTQKRANPETDENRTPTSSLFSAQHFDGWTTRFDQIGDVVFKGVELLEAGLALGVNLANRLSSAVHVQSTNGMEQVVGPHAPAPPPPGQHTAPGYPSGPPPNEAAEAPPGLNYVVNRLPLFPGSPVGISFTINNDSAHSPMEIQLRLEGFVGEIHGAAFDATGFSITPATKVIEPMDFDKFTLTGVIPPQAVSDSYRGWIIVSAETELRIPVRLLVSTPP